MIVFPAPADWPLPTFPVTLVAGTVHVDPPSEEICSSTFTFVVSSVNVYVMFTDVEPLGCVAVTLLATGVFASAANAEERTLTLAFAKASVARIRTFMVALNCPAKSTPASHVTVLFVPAVCAAPTAPASVEVATVHVEPLSEEISKATVMLDVVSSARS